MSCGFQLMITDVMLDEVASSPVLTVTKALGGARVIDTDQFTVQITQNGATIVNSISNSTTTGTGATVTAGTGTTGATNLVANTTYTIKEIASGTSNLVRYDAALACTDAAGVKKDLPLNTGFSLADGDTINCTLTNKPKVPTLRLTKAMGTGGRIGDSDQFIVQILQRISTVKDGTTSGSGSTITDGTTGVVSLVPGSSYTLNEVMKAGSASKLTQYDGVVTCTNAWASSPTSVPSVPGTAFSPTYGDVLDCTITNTAKPTKLTLTQLVITPFPVNLMPPFTFNYSINNGWPLQPQPLTTTAFNVPVSTAQRNLAASNVNTTLSTSLPDARWFVSSFACIDSNAANTGNPTGNLVRVVATSATVQAVNVKPGAALKCTLTMGHKVP